MKIKIGKSEKREAKHGYKITSIRFPFDIAQKIELIGAKAGSRSATDTINQILDQVAAQLHPKALSAAELKSLEWARKADVSARKDYSAVKAKVVKKGKRKAKAAPKKTKAVKAKAKGINRATVRKAAAAKTTEQKPSKPERRKTDKALKTAAKAVEKANSVLKDAAPGGEVPNGATIEHEALAQH